MKKVIATIITAILILGFVSGNTFAEDEKQAADEVAMKSAAAQVVEEAGDAAVEVINTSGDKINQIIEKCGPVLTTLVKETGEKYAIKAYGSAVVSIVMVLILLVCMELCFLAVNKFDDDDNGKAAAKLVIAVIFGIITSIIISVGVYYCFSNWSKAVSPTRTMFTEAVQASN